MRAFLCVGAFVLALCGAAPAQAGYGYAPKYCVRAYDGADECFYATRQQCLAAVWGTGGSCVINPRFVGYPPEYRPRKRFR